MSALLDSFAAQLLSEAESADATQTRLSFQPRQSVWSTVKQSLKPVEVDEVRLLVGEQLIEQNQMLENEIESFLSIISGLDCDPFDPHMLMTHQSNNQSNNQSSQFDAQYYLKAEISLLVEALHNRASINQVPLKQLWSPKTDQQQSIYQSINQSISQSRSASRSGSRSLHTPQSGNLSINQSRLSTRPSSSRSCGSPSVNQTRNQSLDSRPASPSINLPSKLSIYTIDQSIERIQSALKEEYTALMQDTQILQAHLEEQTINQQPINQPFDQSFNESINQPVSDSDLRKFKHELQSVIQSVDDKAKMEKIFNKVAPKPVFSIRPVLSSSHSNTQAIDHSSNPSISQSNQSANHSISQSHVQSVDSSKIHPVHDDSTIEGLLATIAELHGDSPFEDQSVDESVNQSDQAADVMVIDQSLYDDQPEQSNDQHFSFNQSISPPYNSSDNQSVNQSILQSISPSKNLSPAFTIRPSTPLSPITPSLVGQSPIKRPPTALRPVVTPRRALVK